jgi:WD40 repeat protein
MIRDLLGTIRAVLEHLPKGGYSSSRKRIEVLAEAIKRDRSFLEQYPTCLFQSLRNSCYWYDSREARDRYWSIVHGMDIWHMAFLFSESLSSLVTGWEQSPPHDARPWLRAISPPQHRLRSLLASEQKMPWRFSSRLACSPNGGWLAWNGTQFSPDRNWLCVWDRNGDVIHRIPTSGPVFDVAIADAGGVMAVAKCGVVDLHFLQADEPLAEPFLTVAPDPDSDKCVSRVSFAPGGKTLAVGTFAGAVFLYTPDEVEQPLRIQSHSTGVTAFAWQNRQKLLVGHRDGTINRIDCDSGLVTESLPRQVDGPVNDLLVTSAELLLAASGCDLPDLEKHGDLDTPKVPAAIHSWSLRTGLPGESSTEHKSQVNALCLRKGRGEYFSASGSGHPVWNKENAIYRWSEGSTYPSDRINHLSNAIEDLCYIEREQTLFSLSHEGLLQEWRFGPDRDGDFRCRWHDGDIAFIKFSPCGRYFGTASQRDYPLIGRVSDGSHVSELKGHEQSLFSMAFFHNGRFVLTAPAEPDGREKERYYVRLWDVASGELLGHTAPHDRGVYMVAVSEDDRFILTGTGDFNVRGRHIQTAYLWDARSLRLVDQCGGRAWSNADEVSEVELRHMLMANGVKLRPRPEPLWTADRVGEFATEVRRATASGSRMKHEPPVTWLPLVATNAETPYAWHPTEPILAVATGPFLQLFRLENA